jgi:hypothetical protein
MKIEHPRLMFTDAKAYGIIEDHYKGKWCFDMERPDTTVMGAIFYGETVHPVSKSRYFTIYRRSGSIMIANASWVEDFVFTGLKFADGSVRFSYDRHDFVKNEAGGYIDGGTSYIRTNCHPDYLVRFRLVENRLEVIDEI